LRSRGPAWPRCSCTRSAAPCRWRRSSSFWSRTLVGAALAKGIEAEAEASARYGADLYVRGSQFGRPVPLPLSAVEDVAAAHPGVERVVPRIVGEVFLGKEQIRCVLVGVRAQDYPDWAACVEGNPPAEGGPHQLVLGTTLARRLGAEGRLARPAVLTATTASANAPRRWWASSGPKRRCGRRT